VKTRWLLILVGSLLGLCLLVLLLGVAAYYLSGPRTVTGPVVAILSPHHGEQVRVGEVVAVHSSSRDEAQKVVRVELWVDGELMEVDSSPEGASALSIAQGWQPLSPGFHTLLVRASNGAGVHGQATIGVEAVEVPQLEVVVERAPAPEEISTIEEIMQGGDIPTEAELLPPAGGLPSDEEGEEPEEFRDFVDPDFEPRLEGMESTLIEVILPELLDRVMARQLPVVPTMVEFAALDFEVQEDYDQVYCYGSLGDGPMERFPPEEDGFFQPAGGRHWDIVEHLGGQNSRVLAVPQDQALKVFVECFGWSAEVWRYLGELDVSHPREDWDGHIISASGMGGEGFRFDYTISIPTSPTAIPAPCNLQHVKVGGVDYLHWVWEGDEEQIYGFRIYQNDRLVNSVPPGDRLHLLSPLSVVPPCGEEFEYYVKAFRGELGPEGVESPPSNPVHFEGSPCGEEDLIHSVGVKERRCGGSAIELEIDYTYESDHGEVSIGALAYNDGDRVSSIHYIPTRIQHGFGEAQVGLEHFGSGAVTTDQILVFMYDSERRPFYVEKESLNLTWPEPQLDLSITYATVAEALVEVRIRNVGCAPVNEPFTLRLLSPEGEELIETIDTYLNPGDTYVWHTFGLGWAQGFTATVDPDNALAELNEGNNFYEKGPITLKAVEFYMIDVHHPVETYFEFLANEKSARRPQIVGGLVAFDRGLHEMGSMWFEVVTLSPELDWNQSLIVLVCEYKGDYREDCIQRWHSHDISQEDSWKRGGEFHQTSDSGHFTFYWRLIVQ
jgi:hypothetical protein